MVTLVIMDGYGIRKNKLGNAIALSDSKYIKNLQKQYPHTLLKASGESVGLEKEQMGNSEVGHLNIGAGKIVRQDLTEINYQIKTGQFNNNPAINKTIEHCIKNNSRLHIMGLFSDGGVHSHINHLLSIIDLAHEKKVTEILVHAITDGRDTLTKSAPLYVKYFKQQTKGKSVKIASMCGRFYAMDRENRWDRVEKAYDMLLLGKAETYYPEPEQLSALQDSYEKGITDEFIKPIIFGKNVQIEDGDGVIFYNFRSDRAREITKAIIEPDFKEFKRKNLNNVCFCCFSQYDASFKNVIVAFPPKIIENNLSKIISENKLKQFHISETTKYAHVTFFFNGGIEQPYQNEDRKLIESENLKDFSQLPQMKANEITESVIEQISKNTYDFILVNLSNADMIGHTGNIPATMKAIEVVEKCAYAIALATLMAGGDCIITADHGNAEKMLSLKNDVITSHTCSPVPFILISEKYKSVRLKKQGILANIAPTVLKLLGIEIPTDMQEPLF